MRLYVEKEGNRFEVGDQAATGAAKIGVGSTLKKALGDFLLSHQRELGIEIIEPRGEEAIKCEQKRRIKELSRR